MIYQQEPEHGFQIDARRTMYPSQLTVLRRSEGHQGEETSTVLGYCLEGGATVRMVPKKKMSGLSYDLRMELPEGGFFSAPGGADIEVPDGSCVVLIERFGFRSMPTAGSREAERGRLSYIDGCSDTMLVPPARAGDCSLNHLVFPPGINQTQHIHPSIRLGIVCLGNGEAWYEGHWFTPDGTEENPSPRPVQLQAPWKKDLVKGGVFLLEEQEQHSFRTRDVTMHVIAYHPDGDWGPSDFNHPMLNRTYINHGKK